MEQLLYDRQSPVLNLEDLLVTAEKELVLLDLGIGGQGRQTCIQSTVKSPQGKCSTAIIPGQSNTPNREL